MRLAFAAAVLTLGPAMALADEIGGDWCSGTGAHLHIEGDRVQSPGGIWTHGNYSRHSYDFVMPDGEDDAGAQVFMQLLSEQSVLVKIGDGDTEEWRRCDLIS